MNLTTTINEIMNLHDDIREKLLDMLNHTQSEENLQSIHDVITAAATPMVNLNEAFEDILSAIEDKGPEAES